MSLTKLKSFALVAQMALCGPLIAGEGALTFEQQQNLNSQNNREADNNWFTLNVVTELPKKKIDTYLNIDLRYYHNNDDYMYSLSEGYARYQDKRGETVLGRKILKWQKAEQFWNLGDLNGSRGFSLVEDDKEGLFGLHLDRRMGDFTFSFLGSYFYMPQLNPGYKYEDGKVTSKSNWVRVPPKSVKYRGELIPIFYDVEKPGNSEVVRQESIGSRIGYHWDGGELYSYGMYKPENHLRYNASAQYEQDAEERIRVRVRPFVNHHLIYGTGVTQKFGAVSIASEVETVRPDKDKKGTFFEFEEIKFQPSYIDHSSWRTSASLNRNFATYGIHYFHLLSHEGRGDDFFAQKSQWKRAAGASFGYEFTDNVKMKLSYKYDIERADTIFQNDYDLLINRQMMAGIGFSLLNSPRKESYWNPYKSNDTIFTSLTYLF